MMRPGGSSPSTITRLPTTLPPYLSRRIHHGTRFPSLATHMTDGPGKQRQGACVWSLRPLWPWVGAIGYHDACGPRGTMGTMSGKRRAARRLPDAWARPMRTHLGYRKHQQHSPYSNVESTTRSCKRAQAPRAHGCMSRQSAMGRQPPLPWCFETRGRCFSRVHEAAALPDPAPFSSWLSTYCPPQQPNRAPPPPTPHPACHALRANRLCPRLWPCTCACTPSRTMYIRHVTARLRCFPLALLRHVCLPQAAIPEYTVYNLCGVAGPCPLKPRHSRFAGEAGAFPGTYLPDAHTSSITRSCLLFRHPSMQDLCMLCAHRDCNAILRVWHGLPIGLFRLPLHARVRDGATHGGVKTASCRTWNMHVRSPSCLPPTLANR